ncbi:YhjD/YihY/BrkB family envelope integrity protein [Actinomycetospora sp. CA-053990]|uniref:YhjD/YihY/BrkB family envelope integrity protein n=1 Tax=Actinomycetospora sp. CA-053990 TaxID=3239891 RepID=UPI003D8F71CE
MRFLRRPGRPPRGRFRRVLASASTHRVPALAGESAFFTALAVFPALLTVVAILRTGGPALGAGADAAAADGMTRLLRAVLTTRGSAAADAAATLLTTSTTGLLTVGSLAALVLLVRALRSVLYALATIAGRAPRSWRAAVGLAVLLLLGGATVTAAAVQDPLLVLDLPAGHLLWRFLRWPAVVVALLGWAVLVLRTGMRPGRRTWRVTAVGAIVAVGGWLAASALFPLYVSVVGRLTAGLGALGGGLILLVWLYLLTLSLYVAAEIVRELSEPGDAERGRRRVPD